MEQPSENFIPVMRSLGEETPEWKLPSEIDSYGDTSLFSTSLPVLSHKKFTFNDSEKSCQSLDDGFPSLSKVKDPFIDTESSSMNGSFLLPGDDDELLAGLIDDFDLSGLPTQIDDLDDDIFGFEIEPENQDNILNTSIISRLSLSDSINGSISHYAFANGAATVVGEHPYGEHPSRTLFVRNINSNVEDSELKSLFEEYGDIRTLYTACKHRGFVMISYYDIRAARTAMRGLQNKPLRRRKLDIHFSIPKDNPSEKDVNQGTLVVFNLDGSVSNDDLRQIFGAYGEIKEIRETPHKRHHKFIEFYDVRAAEAALKALNRSDIAGKRIKLEPSRPGGTRRSIMQQLSQEQELDEARSLLHQVGSPIANSPPGMFINGSWQNIGSPVEPNPLHNSYSPVGSNHSPGLASILLPRQISSPVKISPIGKDPSRLSYQQHFSVPVANLSPSPISSFSDSKGSSVGTLSGPQFLWGSPTIQSDHINSPATSSFSRPLISKVHGIGFPHLHGPFLRSHHHHHHHHHVGSAPSGVQLDRHFGFFPNSPESSSSHMNKAAFGLAPNIGQNNGNRAFNGNFVGSGSPSSRMMSMPSNGSLYFGINSSFGATIGDGMIDRGRIRRGDSGVMMDNKRQYQLDLEKILNGEDIRTTLMIKNIPNKYTSKMLLAAIDETHKGAFDFLYLPIDFKNKCNVGYAFINMVSPSHIISFFEAFNGKKWEKFNSEKVAFLAYARIQGKIALISHFQNSSLMNEDKRCRPIVIQSEGQDTADLEHFPSANLNIYIRQQDGSYAGDVLDDSPNGDPCETFF
ncbi:hypothetical protein ACP275_13G054700 [Erythranthe tilingii]